MTKTALWIVLLGALVITASASCRAFNNVVLGNKDHGLPCKALPMLEEVQAIMAAHEGVIHEIEQVHPGHVFVEIDELSCPTRGDIVISYASHQDRVAIEALIGDDRFFGVPYRLRNQ